MGVGRGAVADRDRLLVRDRLPDFLSSCRDHSVQVLTVLDPCQSGYCKQIGLFWSTINRDRIIELIDLQSATVFLS
jgi:hypothetical protein